MSQGIPLKAGLEAFPGCRLRQFLGRGGFAEVWEAEVDGGGKLALKFMPAENGRAAFSEIRSIQMVKQLEHPNLVRIERVWAFQNYNVIAMELAEGGLDDLYEAYQTVFSTPIVPEVLCPYLSQAADALDFLNARKHLVDGRLVGIQHCDIKPSNMLLFGDTVKLSDFGLASITTMRMASHRRAGTAAFAPPEVFQGRLSDRTDQYSLAVSYCFLRGGRLPFPAPPGFDRAYVRPKPDLQMISAREWPTMLRALDPVPQNRWPTCREFMAQLTATMN